MLPLLMNTGHIENLLNNLAQSLQWAIGQRQPVQQGLTKEQISKIPEVRWNSSMKNTNQTFDFSKTSTYTCSTRPPLGQERL